MKKNNYIIGTAGHIDHGKTTLIQALTGSDTDRLKEEKERGISIELGFTDLKVSDDLYLGIIDVPGHEKFVKNMLAGAGGVDLGLLVIAADEGVMAQTKEHLSILDLLNVKKGVVALTKIDLVEEEWLELVKEDTKEKLKDTFLEKAPIIPVSAKEGTGVNELKKKIEKIAEELSPKDPNDNIYYPIDRVFTLKGHGTVVTGTLVSGTITVEDNLMVYPRKKELRVRSLQVHNSSVKKAYPGQRVGINIAGADKDELARGDVLAEPGSLPVTDFLDGRLDILKDLNFMVEHGDRIRFHIGAREVLGRVYMIDKENLLPGDSGYVQFRLEEKVVARYKENFVVRRYSPMTTIGGGEIIDNNPPYRRKHDKAAVEELKIKDKGSEKERITLVLNLNENEPLKADELAKKSNISAEKVLNYLSDLVNTGEVVEFSAGKYNSYLHHKIYENIVKEIYNLLSDYHKDYSLRAGLPKEELRSKLSVDFAKKEFDQLLKNLLDKNEIKIEEDIVSLYDFEVNYSAEEKRIREKIIKIYKDNFMPPTIEGLSSDIEENSEIVLEVLGALEREDVLIKLDQNIYFHHEVVKKAEKILFDYFEENNEIELAEYRDLLDSSRKYTLPLLKYFEGKGVIKREGDKRMPV
ncbi:MAG: selenocysteine-specific translation elongation factor [Halanaerobiales bacterium]